MDREAVAVVAPLRGQPECVKPASAYVVLAGRALGDVGHPQLVGTITTDLAPDEVQRRHPNLALFRHLDTLAKREGFVGCI